jgi:hypothetical protein
MKDTVKNMNVTSIGLKKKKRGYDIVILPEDALICVRMERHPAKPA